MDIDENNNEQQEVGVAKEGYLLSASKDTLLKLWDLSAQFCRETIVGHRSEVWSFAVSNDQRIILSGGSEPTVKAWKIDWHVLGLSLDSLGTIENNDDDKNKVMTNGIKSNGDDDVDMDDNNEEKKDTLKTASLQKAINFYGDLPRHSRDRIATIQFHCTGEFVGVQASDKSVELYRVRDHEEIRKKIQRRKKRAKEKGKSLDSISDEIKVEDEFNSHMIIRTPAKVSSFDFAPIKDILFLEQIGKNY